MARNPTSHSMTYCWLAFALYLVVFAHTIFASRSYPKLSFIRVSFRNSRINFRRASSMSWPSDATQRNRMSTRGTKPRDWTFCTAWQSTMQFAFVVRAQKIKINQALATPRNPPSHQFLSLISCFIHCLPHESIQNYKAGSLAFLRESVNSHTHVTFRERCRVKFETTTMRPLGFTIRFIDQGPSGYFHECHSISHHDLLCLQRIERDNTIENIKFCSSWYQYLKFFFRLVKTPKWCSLWH